MTDDKITPAIPTRTAISTVDDTPTIDRIIKRRQILQQAMAQAMKPNIDFGKIPGCGPKPTLLKPGAEKIANLFRLAPKTVFEIIDMPNGHREYRATCSLYATDGTFLGDGSGSCSTMESKYRYRNSERVCPACGESAIIKGKAEYGGGWVCFKKKGGCGATFDDDDPAITDQEVGKVENPDIADVYNTCEKMADKRAFVAAVLKVTGASEVFTQDIEDMNKRRPAQKQPEWTPGESGPIAQAVDAGRAQKADTVKRGSSGHPTEKQVKLIYAVAEKVVSRDFGEWISEYTKGRTADPAELTYDEGQAVIAHLKSLEANAEGSHE